MTFFVIVNAKANSNPSPDSLRNLIVPVESTSNGGAEHVMLDNFRFVTTALSFDPVKESKDYGWAYESCKVISQDEYRAKENRVLAKMMSAHNERIDEIDEAKKEAESLKEQIEQLQLELLAVNDDIQEKQKALDHFDKKYQLQSGYYPIEKINDLIS